MKVRRILYLAGAFFLVLVKFTIDLIGKNVELDFGGLPVIREIAAIGAFALVYLLLKATPVRNEISPVRKLGLALVGAGVLLLVCAIYSALDLAGFDSKSLSLVPLDYLTLFLGSLVSLVFGLFGIAVFLLMRDMILMNRKPSVRRNFGVLVGLILATALSTAWLRPLDSRVATGILFGLALIVAIVNSFRLPWIVGLTKKEKIFGLLYGFFLFVLFVIIDVVVGGNTLVGRSLLYYSYPLREFVLLISVCVTIYAGLAFVSTLFHLPTAEAFDRKRSEVSSLHSLSRLVTQVFDFNELVDTVTAMTLEVVGASRCWLEVFPVSKDQPVTAGSEVLAGHQVRIAGMKNITREQIELLVPPGGENVRNDVIRGSKPLLVDKIEGDPRFPVWRHHKDVAGSLVVVPLISHAGLAGILYATKKEAFGFVKDDVDVISAFADQATVAIENSRLIRESIERERLFREMLVAQEMQKRLLPQFLPSHSSLDIDAISTPAFEVGGDYYDFVDFGDGRVGVIVGDVSGKGVSAAFYMSEMKGIFQALGRMYHSPKEFLTHANEALVCSIDKHSFVSVIYAMFELEKGRVTVARAGHCPLLRVSGDRATYVRPNGLGMGLRSGSIFENAIEEESFDLQEGDVCVLYTDGLTEARREEDEFGYERLLETTRNVRDRTAAEIKDAILSTVSDFTNHRANDDDVTLVIVKWKGSDPREDRAIRNRRRINE
jgi:serine phosphatase RsbU (regulator of sigma subunit)